MAYIPGREKVQNLIDKHIIPNLKSLDMDYGKVVGYLEGEAHVTRTLAEEVLRMNINSKKITEHHVLTISNEEIGDWLNLLRSKEQKLKEMDQEMQKIEESVKGGEKK